jgi:hypothetical protein
MISILPLSTSHIPVAISNSPANGVNISQLIWYARVCSTYDQILSRGILLTDKLMFQGFQQSCLMSALRKFYGRYNDLIHNYKLSISHMLCDIFHTNDSTVLGTLTLTADNSAFLIMELGSRLVWPVDRGCLLLLSTWSHRWYFWGVRVSPFINLTQFLLVFWDWLIFGILATSYKMKHLANFNQTWYKPFLMKGTQV